ncbi:hypothetical protein PENTCL1PPCAC_20342, partial [Pristionchus entomophagus]
LAFLHRLFEPTKRDSTTIKPKKHICKTNQYLTLNEDGKTNGMIKQAMLNDDEVTEDQKPFDDDDPLAEFRVAIARDTSQSELLEGI